MKIRTTAPWGMSFSKMLSEFQRTTFPFSSWVYLTILVYFPLSQHYLFSGMQSQKKKVIEDEGWFTFVFMGKNDA